MCVRIWSSKAADSLWKRHRSPVFGFGVAGGPFSLFMMVANASHFIQVNEGQGAMNERVHRFKKTDPMRKAMSGDEDIPNTEAVSRGSRVER